MTPLEQQCDELQTLIINYQRHVQANHDTDMQGLEQKVEALCAQVMQLPKDAQVPFLPKLTAMLEGLNQLGELLKTQFGEPKAIPMHKNATIAYKTADSRDNFGKRDSDG